MASALLLPFALYTVPASPPAAHVVLATIGLALVSTVVAYLLYFGLIVRVGPTKTHTVIFLIPGFGLGWGVLLLGETVGPGMVIGLGVVLASIALVADMHLGTLVPQWRVKRVSAAL